MKLDWQIGNVQNVRGEEKYDQYILYEEQKINSHPNTYMLPQTHLVEFYLKICDSSFLSTFK